MLLYNVYIIIYNTLRYIYDIMFIYEFYKIWYGKNVTITIDEYRPGLLELLAMTIYYNNILYN